MAEKNKEQDANSSEVLLAKAKNFWDNYNKQVVVVSTVIIVLIGGYYIYQNFFMKPKEANASELMFKAEAYYRIDSVNLALNGDGQNSGFLKVIDRYGGTDAGNLACYYAGSCYIKLGENEKAIKYLKKFTTSSKPVQAKAYKLMADAYGDLGRNKEALEYYKKAAHHFEKDENNSGEYLFMAAYFADRVMKDQKEAIMLYKELKEKFPKVHADDADNFLAQMGIYTIEK